MAEEKKKGLLKRIFGGGSDCCNIELEETGPEQKKNEGNNALEKQENRKGGCCSIDSK